MPFQINNEDYMSDRKEKKEIEIEEPVGVEKKEEKDEIIDEIEEKPENGTEAKVEQKEKTPEEKADEFEEKIKEQEDRYLRLVAEFDNYKKRNARLYDSMIQSSRESLISPLLDVLDNFERALESSENSDVDSFKKGIQLIYQQLNELLKKEGVEPIEAVGQEFNPNLHEAMMQVVSEKYPEGVIVGEVTRGYKVKNKVIRFSKVTVSTGSGESEDKNNGGKQGN